MIKLEDLQPNAFLRGILPNCLVSVVGVQRFGSQALKRTHEDARESGTHRAERPLLSGGGEA